MKNKTCRYLLIAVFLMALIGLSSLHATADTVSWQPGDDIEPIPSYAPDKGLDCDDIALYTYLYLINIGQSPVIKWGKAGTVYHYWIIAGDYAYDYGYPFTDRWYFTQGTQISYHDLLMGALRD